MFKKLIQKMFGKPVQQLTKCRECGELTIIQSLNSSGTCRKCIGFAEMLKKATSTKKTCFTCGRDFASVKDEYKCFYCNREAMKTEPAPMLERIQAKRELDKEFYSGQG